MLMSGEGRDEKKENALKTALDYLDGFLSKQVKYENKKNIMFYFHL